jgi:uncharacterized protein (DUF2235 family)
MPKNIVICCDGTNNQLAGDRTHVARIAAACTGVPEQIVYYDPGVGTMPEQWSRGKLAQMRDLVMGLGTGAGFEENLEEAYRFLMEHYREGDRIFLFGFSRGAYTARALAALIHSVGLLNAGLSNMVRYAVNYWKKDIIPHDRTPENDEGRACEELRRTHGRTVDIHFVGVWDTVSSIGMFNHFKAYPHTRTNANVRCLRQAISIDEKRKCFRQNLASASTKYPDVKNVWFAGVHCDVGGGYSKESSALAMVAFEWMLREAKGHGLLVNEERLAHEIADAAPADSCGPIHNSLAGGWKLVEWLPVRKWNWETMRKTWEWARNKPRNVLRNAADPTVFVHASVLDRVKRCGYKPANLPSGEGPITAKFKIEH